MRQLLLFALLGLFTTTGCKRGPKPDLPNYPDSSQMRSGGNVEGEAATQFHTVLRSSANLRQVRAWYREELVQKRGWPDPGVNGDTFNDGNMTHAGGFGVDGFGTPIDASKPGGYVQLVEERNAVLIDLWQSLPKR
jgi:hypothetical protein